MIFNKLLAKRNSIRININHAYRMDENRCLEALIKQAQLPASTLQRIEKNARRLVELVRAKRLASSGIDSFMYQYNLSTDEGIALMCLAEALLRVPDKQNIDRLIKDKITSANWQSHAGKSESFFVNAATWGLMLTGKVLSEPQPDKRFTGALKSFVGKTGEPVIRSAVNQAMKIMSRQFVMGRTIKEAMRRAQSTEAMGYRYSYDMLGEAARTQADADRYFQAYHDAITEIGQHSGDKDPVSGPGISVKLSALHPRYEFSQHERVLAELTPKLFELVRHAKEQNIGFTVDAEEAARLDLSLDVMEQVFADKALNGWEGFGFALQSYQKRAYNVIDWVVDITKRHKRRMMLRLIKGAYWDTEIKESQMLGLSGYPVFTRKASTDVSFQACAKKIIQHPEAIYPQFATHNAYSVATIMELMGDNKDYEFQCLHGMGQTLYDEIVPKNKLNIPCRIYAPVGSHEDLLPYLVRRLLENGANTSFVNRIVDAEAPIADLLADPVAKVAAWEDKTHPHIPAPQAIYGPSRKNSQGVDMSDREIMQTLAHDIAEYVDREWVAGPIVNGQLLLSDAEKVTSPSATQQVIGKVQQATQQAIEMALTSAKQAESRWDRVPVNERAQCLLKAADLLEKRYPEFIALAIREAGKTIPDAVAEIREAVDFCRYYAQQAREQLAEPLLLKGYTGERDQLSLHGRGTFLCISPWNFPLAIFTGQVVACLVTGNCVVAKPAEQTPLIASAMVALLHQAGIPSDVLHLLPGSGETVGASLVADPRINGVLFTGSTTTAKLINQSLARREGPIAPLIAETGGQNAMIADSSALLEQVVSDVIASAFGSAGQRCSALRVLFVQEDIANKLLTMLKGAMKELRIGDPSLLSNDVGPVIDKAALAMLQAHADRMASEATLLCELPLPEVCQHGYYFAPRAYEIQSMKQLPTEVFGPVLHVIRYKAEKLKDVVQQINETGYGLTLGIHSRINETIAFIRQRVRVGNCYVNRNMIGAVVGLQPFGGENLSGTGPKAGGPHYLTRLCTERTLTINTTAAGGNATLMSLEE